MGLRPRFWVWNSALSFVPVPWPDDSAFYFVAKDLFKWPPRWVMLPQAPFEPSYRIWNFNTMPLYPILLGLGRLIDVGLKTTIYLAPWIFTVVLKPALFIQQMSLQWQRLAVPNPWLSSASSAIRSIFQALGAPNDWPLILYTTAIGIWALILIAAAIFIKAIVRYFVQAYNLGRFPRAAEGPSPDQISLTPAAGWVMGTVWLWNNKPREDRSKVLPPNGS